MVGALITWPCMSSRVKYRSQPRQRNADAKKIPIMFHAQSVLESWIDYLEKRKLREQNHKKAVLFVVQMRSSSPCVISIIFQAQGFYEIIKFVWADKQLAFTSTLTYRTYSRLQQAHFIPIVGVGKRGEYPLVHGDLPR